MTVSKRSERTKVKRIPARGHYDSETINAILDEALVCHVGLAVDGQPYVIPTSYARVGDMLYIHGSAASRMLREITKGIDICVTVSLFDGLVLARSAFHHSINYRSVLVLGKATLVEDIDEKNQALEAITERMVPGRWNAVRPPTELELKGTSVLKLPISEASAKIRTGPPVDDDEDYALDVWAGVLPMSLETGEPISDERSKPGIGIPDHVTNYKRTSRN